MKTFRLIAAGFFFAAIFAVSTFAQATVTAGKIAVINTLAFDADKAGITKFVAASNTLDAEFKPIQAELQTMATRMQALQTELQTAQANAQKSPTVPIDTKGLQAKATQYEEMGRQFKFKQEDAKAKYDNRRGVVLGPVLQDIGKAMQEFAKQKGYMMILDGAKLDESGLILAVGDDKVDVTKEFITFYNARPAGTASAATPK